MTVFTLLREYAATRLATHRDRERLLAQQERAVQRHLAWVLPRSPYTRERFDDRPIAAWRDVTPIGKTEMMTHFDRLNTAGLTRDSLLALAQQDEAGRAFSAMVGDISVGLSSGTSGQLGLFAVSARERALWTGHILATVLPDPLLWPRRDRVAFFLRANNALYRRTGSVRIRFDFFDLLTPMDDHVARLKDLNPTLLIGPPSLLTRLARRVVRGDLALSPRKIVSVAEPLDPVDEALLSDVFQQRVHQVYQATEGFLGVTCGHGTLHLNEDRVAVEREALDDRRFVPVLTDFHRRTQPIVRHRLDDVLTLRETPCPCGSALTAIDAVAGRLGDVLLGRLASGDDRDLYADFVRRALLRAVPDTTDYGVRQDARDRLALYLRPDTPARRQTVTRALQDLFAGQGCVVPEVSALASWPTDPLAKRRRIVRAFST